jgi:DNA-binding response OmpR family regulator
MAILVVEDDRSCAAAIERLLCAEHQIIVEHSASAGRRRGVESAVELIIIDRGLPDGEGLALCQELRADGVMVPILVLTGSDALHEQVAGYDAGCDEYLTKPIQPSLLRAKVLAHLRPKAPVHVRSVGPITIKLLPRPAVEIEGERVGVTMVEFDILWVLSEHIDLWLDGDHLAALVWGPQWRIERSTLYSHISRLRSKLGAAAAHLQTSRGRGWSLRTLK